MDAACSTDVQGSAQCDDVGVGEGERGGSGEGVGGENEGVSGDSEGGKGEAEPPAEAPPTDSQSSKVTWQSLEPQWRRFNFDLLPKVSSYL